MSIAEVKIIDEQENCACLNCDWLRFVGRHMFGVDSLAAVRSKAAEASVLYDIMTSRVDLFSIDLTKDSVEFNEPYIPAWSRTIVVYKREIIEALGYLIPSHLSILDAGCGTGEFTTYLKHTRDCRVAGLDASGKLIEQCKGFSTRVGLDVEWTLGRIEQMPYHDGEFGLVLCDRCLHWMDAGWRKAIKEMIRVNSSDGFLLFTYEFGYYKISPEEIHSAVEAEGYVCQGWRISGGNEIMFLAQKI